MNHTEVLLLTHKENGSLKLPHLDSLRQSNPNSIIHIIEGEDSGKGKRYDWKNSDVKLRNWWIKNKKIVKSETLAVIEWDTLITCELPHIPKEYDLVSAKMMESPKKGSRPKKLTMNHPNWTSDSWFWWGELPLLGLKYGDEAVGLVSFGFYLMKASVLESVSDKKWDDVYKKSIQNELRFPTVAKLSGHTIGEIELPFVRHDDVSVECNSGIFHSVDHTFA
jgi:hypothetical protein